MDYKQHPLSQAFPQMTKAELEALTDDISMEGQREPITLYDGMILDGYHRYLACQTCGRVPNFVNLPPVIDPVAWVKSKNLHRRHLTASQRAAAVVACGEWARRGSNQHGASALSADPPPTVKTLAQEAEVSPRTIEQAKKAQGAGLGEKVRDGELSARAAADLADPPKTKERPDLAPIPSGKILVDEEQWKQLQHDLAETIVDNEMMGKVFEAEDKLKAAINEAKKKQCRIDALELRLKGIMNEKNEAIKKVKSLEKQLAKVEGTVRRQAPGMEG